MAEAKDTIGILYQNLLDAGCDQATIQFCMDRVIEGSCSEILPTLSQYRASLLGMVRTKQKQLDCLDYLLYKLKKEYEEDKT